MNSRQVLLLFVLVSAVLRAPAIAGSAGDTVDECDYADTRECVTHLLLTETDTNSVLIFNFQVGKTYCDLESHGELMPGFMIVTRNAYLESGVMWGRFEYCYQTEIHSVDIDGSGPCEVLTLFEDEDNMWGDVHRLTYSEGGALQLQSLSIPALMLSTYAEKTGIIYDLTPGIDLKFEAWYDDSTICRVVYDAEADSLALKLTPADEE